MNILNLERQFLLPLQTFAPNQSVSIYSPDNVIREGLRYSYLFSASSNLENVPAQVIGVVFSGGPAPGGHDVLAGILKVLRPQDRLIGFCLGPGGLLRGITKELSKTDIDSLLNTGGFDFLGTDRTKISTDFQFDQVRQQVQLHGLNALIIVGGDDSNTNALYLADALYGECCVIGIPKTIDGDLRYLPHLPITFGFHTATQHYASLVDCLMIDSQATRKYWHFVKLMGRASSYVTLEVALQVHPHACLLSEEIEASDWTLRDVVEYFSSVIINRYNDGQPFGVMLFPEGIIDVVPELSQYVSGNLQPINDLLGYYGLDKIRPLTIQNDAHGNLNLSIIPVEDLLSDLVLADVVQQIGDQDDVKIMNHFFGYTGRATNPTQFDAAYSLLLGKTAYELALSNLTGVLATVGYDSNHSVQVNGLPLNSLMAYDQKKSRYVIKKSLVDLTSQEYQCYQENKVSWQSSPSFFPRRQWTDTPIIVSMNQESKEI